jgi:hypothetical protein
LINFYLCLWWQRFFAVLGAVASLFKTSAQFTAGKYRVATTTCRVAAFGS